MMSKLSPQATDYLFDSPIECGLRLLYLLCNAAPKGSDLQRLVVYDYLLAHSSDVNGPPSLHPASPFRSGELLVRRDILDNGLRLLLRKGLIEQFYSPDGITFIPKETGKAFIRYLRSDYAQSCSRIATWIGSTFANQNGDQLQVFADQNLGRWGVEFANEAIFAGDIE